MYLPEYFTSEVVLDVVRARRTEGMVAVPGRVGELPPMPLYRRCTLVEPHNRLS